MSFLPVKGNEITEPTQWNHLKQSYTTPVMK
jgi:hypothetical protein